jgi:prephenate dehydratase
VPFENSTYGPVLTTLDLFAKCLNQLKTEVGGNGDVDEPDEGDGDNRDGGNEGGVESNGLEKVQVCGEAFVQVRHCLLGRRLPSPSSQPQQLGTAKPIQSANASSYTNSDSSPSISHIQTVLSHPQALGQCRRFLTQYLSHATLIEVSSTSAAAEQAAADQTGATAALSSAMAAEVYGLDVLREGVQDRGDNVTRFMVLRRRRSSSAEGDSVSSGETREGHSSTNGRLSEASKHIRDGQASDAEMTAKYKALILFTVSHTSPGALAEALAIFKTHELNLTSINTRPSGAGPWNYFFYVEVEGSAGQEDRLDWAMEELKKAVERRLCLGRWVVE